MMETTNQQPPPQPGGGHIMQSRTSSTSHNLRSNSRGRRSRRYMQIDSESQSQRRSSDNSHAMNGSSQDFNSSAVSMNNMSSTSVNEQSMDENGRCRRHPGIELCRRENYVWRILLQDCPLCSMEVGHNNHNPASTTVKNNGRRKGGESSLKTDTTSPLSEEEECKSWTMSDASCSEEGGSRERDNSEGRSTLKGTNSQQQPPPPPRRKKDRSTRRDESKRSSRSNKQKVKNNQVANLKELAQKLAAENIIAEQQPNHNRASSGDADNLSMGRASNTNSKRGQNPPPPPPRRTTAGGAGDLRNMSTKELSELRRNRKKASQGEMIDEASDLISRMSKMSNSESNKTNTTTVNSRRSRRQSSTAGGVGRDESQAILGAAAEARARAMSRRSKLINDGDVEIPYNDRARSEESVDVARGRMRAGDDNILGAAEEIRLRARRSLSRSRERVKSASLFCGETPTEDCQGYESEGETVATSTSKRSILNPHGLSVPPQAPSVERRSTSRGRERDYTPETNDDESRPWSRNRRGTVDTDQDGNNISSAQALIIRRREMRERIAERQSNAEKRNNMNRSINDTDPSAVNDLANAMLHEWSDVAKPREHRSSRGRNRPEGRERRGRSRSVVRDGISKIRSASLSAFRKSTSSRSVSGIGDDASIETGQKSAVSSIISRITRKNDRSSSRGRSVVSELDDRSDCRSDSFVLRPGGALNSDDNTSSRSSIMRRFSISKSKSVRSSSRGSFRGSGRRTSNSSHRQPQWTDNFEATRPDQWGNNDGLSPPSQGVVKSLSRNNSIGDGMNDYGTIKSDGFVPKSRTGLPGMMTSDIDQQLESCGQSRSLREIDL